MSKRKYDPDGYYDPDPFIGIGTIIAICVIGGVIGGTSIAIQNPKFFDHLLMMINPEIAKQAEEERKASKEFWRIVLIIVLIVAVLAGILLFVKYSKKKKRRRR